MTRTRHAQPSLDAPAGGAPLLSIVPAPEPDCEQWLAPVDRAVHRAARRYRLSTSDADDLRSDVWLKLLARRGRILRKLRTVSRTDTYLAKVACNLVLDKQNAEWGKWRPSAAARRGGAEAVLIDRLTTRDGLSQDAAEAWLRCARPGAAIAAGPGATNRPVRHGRRFVALEALDDLVSTERSPFDAWLASESAEDHARLRAALARAVRALSVADRGLLTQRYVWKMSVADIAVAEGIAAKPLYRYFETLLRNVRQELAAAGFDRAATRRMLGMDHLDWDCGLDGAVVSIRLQPKRSA